MIIWTWAEFAKLKNMGMVQAMRTNCFRCGEDLREAPIVIWDGDDSDDDHPDPGVIALHPACAETLGASLISDGIRAQGKEGDPT